MHPATSIAGSCLNLLGQFSFCPVNAVHRGPIGARSLPYPPVTPRAAPHQPDPGTAGYTPPTPHARPAPHTAWGNLGSRITHPRPMHALNRSVCYQTALLQWDVPEQLQREQSCTAWPRKGTNGSEITSWGGFCYYRGSWTSLERWVWVVGC